MSEPKVHDCFQLYIFIQFENILTKKIGEFRKLGFSPASESRPGSSRRFEAYRRPREKFLRFHLDENADLGNIYRYKK